MVSLLQGKCSGNVALHFKFTITHCTDQSYSICGQVAADKLIKAISVRVKHQHMNNGYGKNEIKRFLRCVGQAV